MALELRGKRFAERTREGIINEIKSYTGLVLTDEQMTAIEWAFAQSQDVREYLRAQKWSVRGDEEKAARALAIKPR